MEPLTIIVGLAAWWGLGRIFGGNSNRSDSTLNDTSTSYRSDNTLNDTSTSYRSDSTLNDTSTSYQSFSSDISARYRTEFTEDDILWEEVVESTELINFPAKDIQKSLKNLIGQKDRVSSEVFHQFQKVYFCVDCQLGYHEDSWEFLDRTCEQCGESGNKVKTYVLPSISDVVYEKNYISPASADANLIGTAVENSLKSKNPSKKRRKLHNTSSESSSTNHYNANILDESCINAIDLPSFSITADKVVRIKGRITSVIVNKKAIYLNFDMPKYQYFYAYVSPNNSSKFHNHYSYVNQDVIVAGKLEFYNGRLQIKLSNSAQLMLA